MMYTGNGKSDSVIDGYAFDVVPSSVKDERTIFVANAESIVKKIDTLKAMKFRELNFKMDNFFDKIGFLSAMAFRSDLPIALSMKIQFDRIEMLFYKKVRDVYFLAYIDDRDYFNWAMAYQRDGDWKFKVMKENSFFKMYKKFNEFFVRGGEQ